MMKRNLTYILIALLASAIVSCTKDADVETIEKNLPRMSISSFGLSPQLTGPFVSSTAADPKNSIYNTLTFIYGASATGVKPGSFDLALYETITSGGKIISNTIVDSIHFDNWSGKDATRTFSINSKTVPTTYPNTTVYNGSVTWKLNSKFTTTTSSKKYSVKAYIRPEGNSDVYTPYQITVSNLITIQ